MPRVRFAAVGLALALLVACAKKEEESGGGGGSRADGQPLLRARTAEDKEEAARRLKKIGLAMHNYEAAHRFFPAGVVGQKGQLGLSWRVDILRYFEGERLDGLYKEFKLNEPWDSEHNKKLIAKMPEVFEAPGAVLANGKTFLRSFTGSYAFIDGAPPDAKGPRTFNPWANQPIGMSARGRPLVGITDGTSNTLMVVEAADAVEWTKPDDLPFLDVPAGPAGGQTFPLPKLGGLFDGGFHGLMCDGSVRFFPSTLNEKTLRAMITVSGGEVVSLEMLKEDDGKPGGPPILSPKGEAPPGKGGTKGGGKKTYGPP